MRILWSVLLLLVLVPDWMGVKHGPRLGSDAHITVTRVAFDPADPTRRRVGDLVWLGGVQLSSHDPAFGGFSALSVVGDRFTLLSDGGNIVRFRMGSDWRLHESRFADLPGGPGRGWEKFDRDSESMSIDPRSGSVWVGFENANAFWRYDAAFTRVEGHVAPPTMRHWPLNQGPESMAMLPRGGMVTIGETTHWPQARGRGGIVFLGDPTHDPRRGFRFNYIPPAGCDPSDMTVLPDGRWLIINRSFAWGRFGTVLTIVDPGEAHPGATVSGRVIARLAAPLIHDNFEGVAVTREGPPDNQATIIWLVSDDNQLWPLQRSLLLKFRLDPASPRGR